MRKDEEIAKWGFACYLIDKLCLYPLIEDGDEPPDYYFYLENNKFAVEVMDIFGEMIIGCKKMSTKGFNKILAKFANNIEEFANKDGFLHGTYYICLLGKSDNFKEDKKFLQKKVLDYIQKTKFLSEAPSQPIFKKTGRRYTMQKIGNTSDEVLFFPRPAKWEGEISSESCILLQKSISTKKEKLEKISFPKILLLLDKYDFSDPKYYKECINQLRSLNFFHSIFIVKNEIEGYFIYTKKKQWWNS